MLNTLKKFISRHIVFPTAKLPLRTSLQERVFIVTGASRGIGRAIVEVLASRGAMVVAVARHPERGQTEDSLRATAAIHIVSGDVTSESDVQSIVEQTVKTFGRIDGVVNNAGVNIFKPLEMTSLAEFTETVDVNVKGAFLFSKHAIPEMKKRKAGLILNIGSKISHNTQVGANKSVYALTKYALEGFSFALNRELKPFGIRVSCLMPGTVNTFVSLNGSDYLSPYQVAEMVATIAEMDGIDFESILFKARQQAL